ncbi:von Willebrand factor D and EGF domain-containing protein isoform X1 [Lingula anatina]|uniref:von Willebrand factor D and EGF domain-containing protein isoform X1 n=1 Tax=Lingula anatina TaxID=7574 RepID=A0A1S3JLV9_LINAN|nr:von Willebrand factor D and EGF domain-containing protein isoform X1 [Lingula anatina]|eukprot:XP_013411362.1 von Willebrand factor D and EGF domain-containing protein isoform X1 [Lingula anatina]
MLQDAMSASRSYIMFFTLWTFLSVAPVYADPCTQGQHREVNDPRRSTAISPTSGDTMLCDSLLSSPPIWYRFTSPAGGDMPTANPGLLKCSTLFPVWLNGNIPSVADGEVTRQACVTNFGVSCSSPFNIKVKNCGLYRVYQLPRTTGCPIAYCAGSEAPCPPGTSSPTGYTPGCSAGFPNLTKKPNLSWTVGTGPEIVFECKPDVSEFTATQLVNMRFDITWYFDGSKVHSQLDVAQGSFPGKLHEAQWTGTHTLGITISCGVKAKYSAGGTPSPEVKSDGFFAGIEILTPKPLKIKSNDPPKQIQLRPTVPVLCPLGLPLISLCPKLRVEVRVPEIQGNPGVCPQTGVAVGPNVVFQNTACGVEIPSFPTLTPGWNAIVSLNVAGTITSTYFGDKISNVKLATLSFPSHPAWSNYYLPDFPVLVYNVAVQLAGKMCYSHNDPHMRTFDGERYENQNAGEFVVYKHRTLPVQVNARFEPCQGIAGATCNCAVAVKSGTDIFIADACNDLRLLKQGLNTPYSVGVVGCDLEGMKIEMTNGGKKFKITLPTGGQVVITYQSCCGGKFLSLDIHPGELDIDNTRGLCGVLNSNVNDDFLHSDLTTVTPHTTSHPNAFSLSWKVTVATESLLTGTPGTTYARHPYCKCPVNNWDPTASLDCNLNNQVAVCVNQATVTSAFFQQCQKRRDTTNDDDVFEPRVYVDYDDFVPAEAEWRNGWNEASAREFCNRYIFSKESVKRCTELSNVDTEGPVEGCVLDIKLSGGTGWAFTAVENVKVSCEAELRRNTSLWIFDVKTNTTRLPDVIDKICMNECSGHGICEGGECICEDRYGGEDCSVDLTAVPVLFGVPNGGVCDIRNRTCAKTQVYGETFLNTTKLICRIKKYEVYEWEYGEFIQVHGHEEPAQFKQFQEIFCPLVLYESPPSLVIKYLISVANDGVNFSNEVVLTVYNPECFICEIHAEHVWCSVRPGVCLIHGNCYIGEECLEHGPV